MCINETYNESGKYFERHINSETTICEGWLFYYLIFLKQGLILLKGVALISDPI